MLCWAYILKIDVLLSGKFRMNISTNFHASLWCLKKFFEGFKGLHKTFWGTTEKCENTQRRRLTLIIPFFVWKFVRYLEFWDNSSCWYASFISVLLKNVAPVMLSITESNVGIGYVSLCIHELTSLASKHKFYHCFLV